MDDENPKDQVAQLKIDLSLVPPAFLAHTAHAMMDGARKYGAYNWRGKKVKARVYVSACMRHLLSWLDGEERALDSYVHHLGGAAACLAILLDAGCNDCLVDDRPPASISGDMASILSGLHHVEVCKSKGEQPPIDDCGDQPSGDCDFCGQVHDGPEVGNWRHPPLYGGPTMAEDFERHQREAQRPLDALSENPAFKPWSDLDTKEKRAELRRFFGLLSPEGHEWEHCDCPKCIGILVKAETFLGRLGRG